jgi:Tol biopolymer transport system component
MKRLATALLVCAACAGEATPGDEPAGDATGTAEAAAEFPADPAEPRLANLRQLTFDGENAEAYFSADGQQLIFQTTDPPDVPCDQIFIMNVDGTNRRRVSNGEGRTTCAYFFPAGDRIVYASTHLQNTACPAPPDRSRGYVWGLFDFDIFSANRDGSDLRRLTETPGYDAEATISPDGSRIVFTSARDGDLDIYTMDADGGNVQRLTTEPGYDGGPFFSPDGTKIVYRAHHPTDAAELADFRALLSDGLVRPGLLAIWVMDADGSNKRQITDEVAADFAPFFHPGGEQIIFSSNRHDPQGRNFDLYMINLDGTGLEQITVHPEFDGFPMFSPDGRKLVFASNRGAREEGDTNIFIADWVENPATTASR